MRNSFIPPFPTVIFSGRVLGLWLRELLLASALITQRPQMKHIVFDNWLLMAIVSAGKLRVQTLGAISLFIPGEDNFGATFAAH